MNVIPVDSWKEDMQVFQEAAKKYYAGELKRAEYKGISGKFGSYAQHPVQLRHAAGHPVFLAKLDGCEGLRLCFWL